MTRIERVLLYLLIGLLVPVCLLWTHSHLAGHDRVWSEGPTAGRGVSARGLLFEQRCELNPPILGNFGEGTPEVMPAGFAVGSNPSGECELIRCDIHDLPFAMPSPGMLFGHGSYWQAYTTPQSHWSSVSSERVIAYRFVAGLLAGPLVVLVVRAMWRRWRATRRPLWTE